MDKREIEELREKVGCAALPETDGWKVDAKESTRRAIKYRRDGNIIIVIHEGRNRQIRRMCSAVGLPVRELRRVRMGPIGLGRLKPGQWRDLTPDEVRRLKHAAAG